MYNIVEITTHDPAFNLALEESLFNTLTADGPAWFLIWRNSPSVIIGRHQNTLEEIDQGYVRKHEIQIVRRPTGGGAVYHDLGNVNFSFLFQQKDTRPDLGAVLQPVLQALHALGVRAELSGRNDITVAGRKVSGVAMRRNLDRHLVHGTLLVDLDLDQLGRCLKGNPDKYLSKGVASVRARVANLRELLAPGLERGQAVAMVIDALKAQWPEQPIELPDPVRKAAEQLAEEKYRTWDWNYGHSPKFDLRKRRRFSWGAMENLVAVSQGKISGWTLRGDFFCLKNLEDLERSVVGLPFTELALRQHLLKLEVQTWFAGAEPGELVDFLCEIA